MAVDWSELQPEFLDIISRKLTIYVDYLRFRAVCTKWRSNTSPTPCHLPCQVPWVMLPFDPQNKNYRGFFNLSEINVHWLNLPEISCGGRITCCGSSQGWLVLVELSPSIFLLNPLSRIQIQLPPLTSFPNVLNFNVQNEGEEYLLQDSFSGELHTVSLYRMRDSFIKKVVLSSSPNSPDEDYIAVAIFISMLGLAFCKKGSEAWTMINEPRTYFEDVTYYKGLFYAVNTEGSLVICDFINGLTSLVTVITPPPQPVSTSDILYLVDSFEELLLVCRHLDNVDDNGLHYLPFGFETDGLETVGFEVYIFDSSGPKWVEVTSLGDSVLFVGGGYSSLCLPANDISGCEGNCIYFTDDYSGLHNDGPGCYDMGVFNLGDGSIKPLPYRVPKSWLRSPAPIWVTPNPC